MSSPFTVTSPAANFVPPMSIRQDHVPRRNSEPFRLISVGGQKGRFIVVLRIRLAH